jgi:hypothetical protein
LSRRREEIGLLVGLVYLIYFIPYSKVYSYVVGIYLTGTPFLVVLTLLSIGTPKRIYLLIEISNVI